MTVTYRIRPEAVWSDGEPITSTDFEYTWKQIVDGKDIYDTTGYVDIESIDTSDPQVAVVTFSEPFAGWRDLFGGFYFVLPSHLLEGKNRNKVMKDGYAFSAGPWELEGRQGRLEEGQDDHARPQRRVLGHEAHDRQGHLPVHPRELGRARGGEDGPGRRGLPAADRRCARPARRERGPQLHGELREPVRGLLHQRQGVSPEQPGGAPGDRLRHRPSGDRRPDPPPRDPRGTRAAELHRPDVPAVLRPVVRAVRARSGDGRRADDRRRVGAGLRRHLGEERQEGHVRDQLHRRQREPCADRADLAEPAPPSRLRPEDQEPELGRAVRRAPAEGPVRRRARTRRSGRPIRASA